jgi:hypothetical protein
MASAVSVAYIGRRKRPLCLYQSALYPLLADTIFQQAALALSFGSSKGR